MGGPTAIPVRALVEDLQYSAREPALAQVEVDQQQEQDQEDVDHLAVGLLEVLGQVETLVVDMAQDQEDVDHLAVVILEAVVICNRFWGLVGGLGQGPGLGPRTGAGGETMRRELMVGGREHRLESQFVIISYSH